MSRRTWDVPCCFYCDDRTEAGLVSAIDHQTPVCADCSAIERMQPQDAVDEWFARGGDRLAAIVFDQPRRGRPRMAVAASAGGAL